MGVIEETELEVAEDVFDYVNEKEYAKIVQQRQEEGFVLDDGEWGVGVVRGCGLPCLLQMVCIVSTVGRYLMKR